MATNSKPKPQTPAERFADAAKHIFNLPKPEVDKIKAETPLPKKKGK